MTQFTYTKSAWYTSPGAAQAFAKTPEGQYLELYDCDMAEHGWVPAGQATVTVQLLAPAEVTSAAVAALQKAINKVQADTGVKVMALQQMISDLLCLENKPTGAAEDAFEHKVTPNFDDEDDRIPF